jgi:two-component system chemotaxis response regulator CheY
MSMTVLTVDDSRTMREMLRLALADAGFLVVQAEDGVHGLEVLQAQAEAPQVIVTDINMPRMDGFGFIEEVRGDQRYRGIPILVLTTESDAEKKNRARMAGATGWIVKPFNPVKLVDAIRRVAA